MNIKEVINKELCIGCGGCTHNIKDSTVMYMAENGIFQPKKEDILHLDSSVCPFINKVKDSNKCNSYLGDFKSLYAGYSVKHRKSSSSGGIATWTLEYLLDNNIVDKVICVGMNNIGIPEYKIVNSSSELESCSKTKYYPLTMESIIKDIKDGPDCRYAITGVPCYINTLSLLRENNEIVKKRLIFLIGIFCGGMKSKFFTEYLSENAGVSRTEISNPEYRVKNKSGMASNYNFRITKKDNLASSSIPMSLIGDMWGTGMFKPLGCDYCEDLCAENSDISFGDAWIAPYDNDHRGNSVLIVRSEIAQVAIRHGLENKELVIDSITEKQMCNSQLGNITHRRKGLSHRLSLEKSEYSHLKTRPKKSNNPTVNLVQKYRSLVRDKSQNYWPDSKNLSDFESKIYKYKKRLYICTKLNHLTRVSFWKRMSKKIINKFRM